MSLHDVLSELDTLSRQATSLLTDIQSNLNMLTVNYDEIRQLALQESDLTEDELQLDTDSMIRKWQQVKELEKLNATYQQQIDNIEAQINEIDLEMQSIGEKIDKLEKAKDSLNQQTSIYQFLSNKRLLKRALSLISSEMLNQVLSQFNIFDVNVEVTENDDIEITAKNNNGETVRFADLSQGEQALARLTLHLALRELLKDNVDFRALFFDEFIDHLDSQACATLLPLLKDLSNSIKIFVITFNQNISDNDIWDDVINMEDIT